MSREDFATRDTAAVLAPVPNGKALAAILAASGVRSDVVEVPRGSFAILLDAGEGAADRAAQAVSLFAKDAPVLAMERRGGHVTIVGWRSGERGDELPPGLALDQAPATITEVMLGTLTSDQMLAENPEAVHSGRVGRLRGLWRLRRLAAQARREMRS